MEEQALALFGGAVTASVVGAWFDASDVRPVPDHQEVWCERAGAERSLVIELLDRVEAPDDAAATEHFEELASGNDASSSAVVSTQRLPVAACHEAMRTAGLAFHLRGKQVSASCPGTLHVELVLLRLAAPSTDLLITVTRQAAADVATAVASEKAEADRALVLAVLSSLRVCDWGLFGAE